MKEPDHEAILKVYTEEKLKDVVERAQLAFWAVVAESFPEIKTGDYSPDATVHFDQECKDAIGWWLIFNDPYLLGHKVRPLEGQCGTCKFAACFDYADSPSGPEDGVHCTSEAHVKMMDEQTQGDCNNMEEFKAYGFVNLWRLEQVAEESCRCPNWEKKG